MVIEDGDRRWRSEIDWRSEIGDGDRRWRSEMEIGVGDRRLEIGDLEIGDWR